MQFLLFIVCYGLSVGYCSSPSGYNLYHTDYHLNDDDRDCLYYFVPKKGLAYQFIQYCVRFMLNEEILHSVNYDNSFTFEELQQRNISTDQLYQWSAPIDLIEHYQIYLETNASMNQLSFYNCTYPWFGSYCEYRFDEPQSSFDKLVKMIFAQKLNNGLTKLNTLPCYEHLQCDRVGDGGRTPGACLDWREVCDGKVDCIDGEHDEEFCWQLEINDCDEQTEYRCDNGLCIPLAFLHDDIENTDCLDRTDEILYTSTEFRQQLWQQCVEDPAFRCEDHRCHRSLYQKYTVECGDGSCMRFFLPCLNKRDVVLRDGFWSRANVSNVCRFKIECFTKAVISEEDYEHCRLPSGTFINDIKQYCPALIELPPILFDHVRLIYTNDQNLEKLNLSGDSFVAPDYICYAGDRCEHDLFASLLRPSIDLFGNNSTCRPFDQLDFPEQIGWTWESILTLLYNLFWRCSNYNQPSSLLEKSHWYKCMNSSKIISQYHLMDGIEDCVCGDDESYAKSCSLENFNHRFQCDEDKNIKCLAQLRVMDGRRDCEDGSDEKDQSTNNVQTSVAFQIMCDGYFQLYPTMIDGRNETDETECTHFSCNNIYTRCDGFWNCPDGADEVNCEWPPLCPPLHHMCISSQSGNLTCLHMKYINNGINDCFGASDERQFCRHMIKSAPGARYRCLNTNVCIASVLACMKPSICPMNNISTMNICQHVHGAVEIRCTTGRNLTHIEQLLCTITDHKYVTSVHFALTGSTSYAALQMPFRGRPHPIAAVASKKISQDIFINDNYLKWICNRGLMVHRFIDSQNNTQIVCLCPPAYYGHFCQYQNQRVSLTVKVRASFEFRTLFLIVLSLRDNQENRIESHDQISYFYDRDCRTKFNIYLLYTSRPKNTSTNYSVHIDIFNKQKLEHHASWLFPVLFPFLPVYRMGVQLQIPPRKEIPPRCTIVNCGLHGHCSHYVNTKTPFCLCQKGWSGTYCHVQHTCHCSLDSICVGPNICVCPLGKFGARCFLKHAGCSCQNGGTCVPDDERSGKEDHVCLCSKGFSGSTCEKRDTIITLSFASDIPIPPSVLVHFIEVFGKNRPHIRSTTFKKIEADQETVTFLVSSPFHIVFTEIGRPKTYYLTALQPEFVPSINISSTVRRADRCLSINELFNQSFVQWHSLRRIKYYHLPCQEQRDLACFFDETHMCLCHSDLRQANCLTFNHSKTNDCEEQNPCENQGQCFRDDPNCPTTFMCVCNECSYGSRCQFSTKGFGLTLDAILGYHIQSNQSFKKQRFVIHLTAGIVTLIFIVGMVGSILSIMTFQTKKACEVGCGRYLLLSSLTSMVTMIIFLLKFYFLLFSQMNLITNRDYLTFNCIFIEYMLKVLLSVGDWLNAFVGIERAMTVQQDVKFNKIKAKRMAKCIIVCTYIITAVTHVHDPIYRRLIDDHEEQEQDRRTWCHVQFSPSVQLFNSIIVACHFFLPFLLNSFSALFIIINTARQRSTVQKQQPYRHQLHKQFYELKHLLISPVILIVLASPRLVISFVTGCMKTTRGYLWIYLTGYLVSFLPPMLLFVVFFIPSETYKKEFNHTIKRIQRYIRSQLH